MQKTPDKKEQNQPEAPQNMCTCMWVFTVSITLITDNETGSDNEKLITVISLIMAVSLTKTMTLTMTLIMAMTMTLTVTVTMTVTLTN